MQIYNPAVSFNDLVLPKAVSAAERAAEVLRAAIFKGTLRPGQRLKEEELARVWGLSRTPVREALLILETEGIIESAANRGARVRTYDPEELRVAYAVRAEVEGIAAELAAHRLTESVFTALEESLARSRSLRESGDVAGLADENIRFHTTIVRTAGMPRLSDLARQVTVLPMVYRGFFWYSPTQRLAAERRHASIVASLRQRDAVGARARMREHVLEAGDFVVRESQARSADAAAGQAGATTREEL